VIHIDDFAFGQAGEVFLALLLAAVGVDRVHHQARLDRHCRSVAGVHPLDRARDQAIADITEVGTAILAGDGSAEQAEPTHFAQDLAIEMLIEIGFRDARLKLVLSISFSGVADHSLFVAELPIEAERIFPIERQNPWLAHVVTPRCWYGIAATP